MTKFEGKWKYQSFRPDPGSLSTDRENAKFVLWSPSGEVTVDKSGATGTLVLVTDDGIVLNIGLKINTIEGSPDQLSISAVMPLPGGKKFTNELHGWFVPKILGQDIGDDNPLVVRGSIVQTSPDIDQDDPQPIYTTGFFVLEPLKE
ncbi:MAG: hypothetical protein AAGA80_12490 [Cyanobacteria bacterium P01_F01_bin.143]